MNDVPMTSEPSGTQPKKDGNAVPVERRGKANALRTLIGFSVYVWMRFRLDGCQQRASSLTFTTLLAIVPLLAVSFAIFSAFPAFERLEDQVMDMIFDQIPQVGPQVGEYLISFRSQTGSLTAVGIIFLAVTAVMLLMTTSATFDAIWRADKPRGLVSKMLVFWAVLTLAPMFIGASFSLSTYLFAVAQATGVEAVAGGVGNLAYFATFLMQAAGLVVIYLFMPNYPVKVRDAIIGGLIAAILLDLLKRGFGIYVTEFPTYETIYGAMATVPIFLIWMYVGWMIVLFGAEVTAGLPEWRQGLRTPQRTDLPPTHRFSAALSVLHTVQRAAKTGHTVSERQLSRLAGLSALSLGWATRILVEKQYITKTEQSNWVLARDLSQVTLATLYEEIGLDLSASVPRGHANTVWGQRFGEVLGQMRVARDDVMGTDLKTLLTTTTIGKVETSDLPINSDDDEEEENPTTLNARILSLLGLGAITGAS